MTEPESYLFDSPLGVGHDDEQFGGRRWVRIAGDCSRIVAAGLARPRRRLVARTVSDIRRTLRGALPLVAVEELVDGGEPTLRESPLAADDLPQHELRILLGVVLALKPRAILEIGTAHGRTALHLALNTPAETVITTVDLPEGHVQQFHREGELGFHFRNSDVLPRIRQIRADSTLWDRSDLPGAVDFVFVDANHEANPVISDSLLALACLRDAKGTIVWHDHETWPGVTAALERLHRVHPAFSGLRSIGGTSLAILRLS